VYVSKKSRIGLTVGLVVALVLAARVSIAFKRFSKVEQDFHSIQQGQPRASVTTNFGKPNYYAGKCGKMEGEVVTNTCALEYVYSHPFAPLWPDYYVVSFSADDRVIQADHWVSP
jgi:hypothetical protein